MGKNVDASFPVHYQPEAYIDCTLFSLSLQMQEQRTCKRASERARERWLLMSVPHIVFRGEPSIVSLSLLSTDIAKGEKILKELLSPRSSASHHLDAGSTGRERVNY